jgi:AGCS family alanine or glycine:cation symporter
MFDWNGAKYEGVDLSIAAFNDILPGIGGTVVTISTIFFALSTILGWAYYGEVCMEFLTRNSKKAVIAYRIVYVAFVFIGAVASLDVVWGVSTMMNGLMAIPNLIGVLLLSPIVVRVTCNYINRHIRKVDKAPYPMLSAYADIQAEQEAKLKEE